MPHKKRKKRPKSRERPGPTERMRPTPVQIRSAGSVLLDHEDRQLVIFSRDILINQLRREGPAIEASFDKLCENDLREISSLFADCSALTFSGLKIAARREYKVHMACAEVLMNASNSIASAVALLRMGYVLQPGILIRSVLESISTALHLAQHPNDFGAYEAHLLQSPKTMAAAKRVLPPFGRMYGFFSDNFAHIGMLHKSVTPVREFHEREPALETNLMFVRLATWLLYVTCELLFGDMLHSRRYWQPKDRGYVYAPSEAEREWMMAFLRSKDVAGEHPTSGEGSNAENLGDAT